MIPSVFTAGLYIAVCAFWKWEIDANSKTNSISSYVCSWHKGFAYLITYKPHSKFVTEERDDSYSAEAGSFSGILWLFWQGFNKKKYFLNMNLKCYMLHYYAIQYSTLPISHWSCCMTKCKRSIISLCVHIFISVDMRREMPSLFLTLLFFLLQEVTSGDPWERRWYCYPRAAANTSISSSFDVL